MQLCGCVDCVKLRVAMWATWSCVRCGDCVELCGLCWLVWNCVGCVELCGLCWFYGAEWIVLGVEQCGMCVLCRVAWGVLAALMVGCVELRGMYWLCEAMWMCGLAGATWVVLAVSCAVWSRIEGLHMWVACGGSVVSSSVGCVAMWDVYLALIFLS